MLHISIDPQFVNFSAQELCKQFVPVCPLPHNLYGWFWLVVQYNFSLFPLFGQNANQNPNASFALTNSVSELTDISFNLTSSIPTCWLFHIKFNRCFSSSEGSVHKFAHSCVLWMHLLIHHANHSMKPLTVTGDLRTLSKTFVSTAVWSGILHHGFLCNCWWMDHRTLYAQN